MDEFNSYLPYMQDAVKYAIYHDSQPLRIFESRKCKNRKYFNPRAVCQKGFYKCSTNPEKLMIATYQDALVNCSKFLEPNKSGKFLKNLIFSQVSQDFGVTPNNLLTLLYRIKPFSIDKY